MRIGVCYYPEQTAPENLTSDLNRMKDTGISLIRVGEFAWSKVEPVSYTHLTLPTSSQV